MYVFVYQYFTSLLLHFHYFIYTALDRLFGYISTIPRISLNKHRHLFFFSCLYVVKLGDGTVRVIEKKITAKGKSLR